MSRPAIPEDIKRRVRQHCGYGCIICGKMPTEYEHVTPYAKCQAHDFENIVLLCPWHHTEVTAGRLYKREVETWRANPYLRQQQNSGFYEPLLSPMFKVVFGNCGVAIPVDRKFNLFNINGYVPFSFLLGSKPKFNLDIFGRDGKLALSIIENVIEFRAHFFWDITLTGTKFKVVGPNRKVFLDISITDGIVNFKTFRSVISNVPVIINKNGIHLPNTKNSTSQMGFAIESEELDNLFVTGEPGWVRSQKSLMSFDWLPSPSYAEAWNALFNV